MVAGVQNCWMAVLAAIMVGSALTSEAAIRYWNGNVSQDWANGNNFQRSGDNVTGVPLTGDDINLESWATQSPLINNSGHAVLQQVFQSKDMTIAAGGVLNASYSFKIGQNASATLTVSGGTFTVGNHLDVGGYNGGTATMNVTGGSITVAALYLNLNAASTGASYLNLYGGTITDTGSFSINSAHPAVVNLAGGKLIVPSSQLGNVTYWINNSFIKGFGVSGVGAVNVDSSSSPGNLVITGVPTPTTRYWNGNISQDWANAGNFQENGSNNPGSPQTGDNIYLESWAAQSPLINNSGHAVLQQVFQSKDMTIASGGVLNASYSYKIGQNGSATLDVTGGSLTAGNHLDVGGYSGGIASMNVMSGSVSVGNLFLNLNSASTGGSYLTLNGGTVTVLGSLAINTVGAHSTVINLAGGTLILTNANNNLNNANYWIAHGNITAYGWVGYVTADTSSSPGNIILTGQAAPAVSSWYWNGHISKNWNDANNFQSSGFDLPGLPEAGNDVYLESWATQSPLINNGGHAVLQQIFQSKDMTIAAGGALDASYSIKVGQNASASLDVTGGAISAANHLDVGGYNGGTAALNVSGGSLTAGGFYLNLNSDANSSAGSYVALTGGSITDTGAFSISESHPALLNIAGGKLVVPVSQQGNVNFWIGDGSIAAHGIGGTTNSFNFDATSVPGSLVITSKDPTMAKETFPQWNPQAMTNLPSGLDQAMPLVPAGLGVMMDAQSGFGTAVAANGDVYFTEYSAQRIRKYNPVTGGITTVVTNLPGVFGVAVDTNGNLFYAIDSDSGSGYVVKRTSGGSEQTIITNLTRPRQLATDASGNVYVVLESARQILKWDKNSSLVSPIIDQNQCPATPQGVAVAPDGKIYFSAYGRGAGAGTFLTQGTVWLRATNGSISLLAGGFARARGVALHPDGSLYVITEANVWDNGNSGVLAKIATNGIVTQVVKGIDYAQFPAIGTNGILYVTSARDSKLLAYNPAQNFSSQSISQPGVTLIADGASWQAASGGNYPFQLHLTNTASPANALNLTGYLQTAQGAAQSKMWFNVPVTNFTISLAQFTNSAGNTNSGMFALPSASVGWNYGPANVQVVPLRKHQLCRWPMTNPGVPATETPAAGFAEMPVSYLVFVSVVNPPTLKVQPWTGGQIRISWPAVAADYALKSSGAVAGGYTSAGLTVTTEGSENAAYDSIGSAAKFYRLIK